MRRCMYRLWAGVAPAALATIFGMLPPADQARAACTPATGDNVTVTCSGTTPNQGPGINTGYGASNQNGTTINIQSTASVIGTSNGIDVNNNNIINNLGTITTNGTGGIGNVNAITTNGPLTVNNSGTIGRVDLVNPSNTDSAGINSFSSGLVVTNTSTGIIQGAQAISSGGVPTTTTVTNSGLINGVVGGGGVGIFADTLNLTNNASGTITADANAIQTNTAATIFNYGTISAPGVGSGGNALNVNALTLVNYASGVITGDGSAVLGGPAPVTITNFGSISSTGSGSTALFLGSSATITNNVGGTIVGDLNAIQASNGTTIFNAGTITGVNGGAIVVSGVGNTLTIAPTSQINGNVTFGGTDTFQLGGTGSGIFDLTLIGTQYTGFAVFNKVDGSTWTLTGSGNQAWTVQGGTLLVNGDLSASPGVTVQPGGTLGGTGVLPTTNIQGGVFAPGPGNAPGTIVVNGNLNFQNGSTYLVELSPSAAATANVSGTATLAGTVLAVLQPGGYMSRTYTIMTANSGFGGSTFGGLAFGTPGFSGTLSYTPTTVVLDLTAQLGQGAALGQNQQGIANAINSFFNNGGALPPAFFTVFNAGAGLSGALSQLSGEAVTGSQQSAFQLMDEFLTFMLDPFVGGGDIGRGGGAMSFAPANGFASNGLASENRGLPDDAALAYNAVLKAPAASFEQRWSTRGAAYGGYDRTNGDPLGLGTHDLTARTGGLAAALDYHVTRDSVLGLALAGGETNWGLASGLGSGSGDAFQAGLYGATRNGPAYLAASLAYAWHQMKTDRFAPAGDELTARFDAGSLGGRLEGGYRVAGPAIAVTPYAAVQAQSLFTPAFSETDVGGGGFGLSFASRTANDVRSELGARFDHAVMLTQPSAMLALETRLAWARDWTSDPIFSATFETLPGASFLVNGALPAKNSALATASAELQFADGISLMGKFDGDFAGRANTYAGTGVARYRW